MKLLRLIALILYSIFILVYFKKVLLPKKQDIQFYLAPIVINLMIAVPSYFLLDERMAIYPLMAAMMLITFLLFHCNWVQVLFVGVFYMFTLYSSLGVIVSLHSMILHVSINQVIQKDVHEVVFIQAVLLSISLILFFRNVVLSDARIKHLFNNKGQLKFIVGYLCIQLVYLTLINDGLFREVNQSWFSSLYLLSCIISKLWFMFVVNHTARVTELLDFELHTHQLREQLSRQVRHYQAYQRFTESFQIFRHDYEQFMAITKSLLSKQEYHKAEQMLDTMQDCMEKEISIHKTYSNNVILDAILQDAANLSNEKGIDFNAYIHLSEKVTISDLNLVRIFSNLIENAIEACEKVTDSNGFIEINSKQTDVWQVIEVVNSNTSKLVMRNGVPQTTKPDKDYHGFGFMIVKTTIEELGGQAFIEQDSSKQTFKLTLCIPKH